MQFRSPVFIGIVTIVLFAIVPLWAPIFVVLFITEALILGLFAMSLDLQSGYSRMVSFGHSGPYGLGAYATALLMLHGQIPLPIAVLLATCIAALVAVPIGWMCTRGIGVAYAMLTLAFSQLAYAVAIKWQSVTGGSDGLPGLKRVVGPFGMDFFTSGGGYYLLVLGMLLGSFLLCRLFVYSPVGTTVLALRGNETKALALGYDVRLYRLGVFILSNALAGLAGGLYAGFAVFVSPELFFWTVSGQVLVMVIVGGSGTLLGPIVGAAIVLTLEHQLSAWTDSWGFFLGAIFVAVVIYAPRGIWGLLQRRIAPATASLRGES